MNTGVRNSGSGLDAGRKLSNMYAPLDDAIVYVGTQRPLYKGSLSPERMTALDSHAKACPAHATKSISQLAAYLGSAARSPEERVRAICFWLHLNVQYDTKSYFSGNVRSMSAEDVLRARTSVCHGFARLMKALCEACDVECQIVTGYAKGITYDMDILSRDGPSYKSNHNWTAVRLYSSYERAHCWYLIDPTWCAGYCNGTTWVQKWQRQYFMPDPITFSLSHFPEDAKWTLLPETQRATWRAFVTTINVRFPWGWEQGIVPLTHRRPVVTVPEDGRLHLVFRARKEKAYMLASFDGGSGESLYPSTLPRKDDSGAELLAFDIENIRSQRATVVTTTTTTVRNGVTRNSSIKTMRLRIFASSERYSTYTTLLEYVLVL